MIKEYCFTVLNFHTLNILVWPLPFPLFSSPPLFPPPSSSLPLPYPLPSVFLSFSFPSFSFGAVESVPGSHRHWGQMLCCLAILPTSPCVLFNPLTHFWDLRQGSLTSWLRLAFEPLTFLPQLLDAGICRLATPCSAGCAYWEWRCTSFHVLEPCSKTALQSLGLCFPQTLDQAQSWQNLLGSDTSI